MPDHNFKTNKNMTFSDEITHRHGGETLKSCYQCGTCASSCPIAKIDPRFNPREVIKLALLGERGISPCGPRCYYRVQRAKTISKNKFVL